MTPRQKQTYDYIKSYIDNHGISPSYDEIMNHFGLKSKSSVKRYIDALYDRGYIMFRPSCARSIRLIKSKEMEFIMESGLMNDFMEWKNDIHSND